MWSRVVPLGRGTSWLGEVLASLVVFLVALPLCLGIALASGVPPAVGLVTGVVGGLVVGFFQGSPVSVSGPAAGLTVIVAEIVREGGVVLLSAVVLAAGVIQFAAGVVRAGRWFRAVPPSLIHGMLAGIGVLIMAGQLQTMVDARPKDGGLRNLLAAPSALNRTLSAEGPHAEAALIAILTLAALLAWKRWAPPGVRMVPPTLVGVGTATTVANLAGLRIARVGVPNGLVGATNLVGGDVWALLGRPAIWATALGLALVASAETLLCAGAVDRLHQGPRTDYERELRAQGIGNVICGTLGALPMTAVIARSTTNVQAGGRTRAAAILHGAWILLLVSVAPAALRLVPISSLAAVLVFTGWKLIDRNAVRALARHGRGEIVVYAVTVAGVVATDLLKGVALGLVVAAGMLLYRLSHLRVDVEHDTDSIRTTLHLRGAATFLRLPHLTEALAAIPPGRELHIRLGDVNHMDHAAVELLMDWERTQRAQGGDVIVEWSALDLRDRPVTADQSGGTRP